MTPVQGSGGRNWGGWGYSSGILDAEDELFIEQTAEREEMQAARNVLDSLPLYNSIEGDRALLVSLVPILRALGFSEDQGSAVPLHCSVGHLVTKDTLMDTGKSLICLMCEDQIKKWEVFP